MIIRWDLFSCFVLGFVTRACLALWVLVELGLITLIAYSATSNNFWVIIEVVCLMMEILDGLSAQSYHAVPK